MGELTGVIQFASHSQLCQGSFSAELLANDPPDNERRFQVTDPQVIIPPKRPRYTPTVVEVTCPARQAA